MRQVFKPKRFNEQAAEMIHKAVVIIDDYRAQGFTLTLRQIYYQFVARDEFPDDRTWSWNGSRWIRDPQGTKNAEPNYKWLGKLVSDGRLAGLIDWSAIEDRTRNLVSPSHWESPAEIVQAVSEQFRVDLWEGQQVRPEVWIEKDALVGVIAEVCDELDVAYFACRGYVSQSAQWEAGRRIRRRLKEDRQATIILHLGDHDPSGVDMTRDNRDRVSMFGEHDAQVVRLALNMNQVEEYEPPPNPTKMTDSRAGPYVDQFGMECWELDALEPRVINDLIRTAVEQIRDDELMEQRRELQREGRERLAQVADDMEYQDNDDD